MSASTLASALRSAGLVVAEYEGWENRGYSWADDRPVGVMEHHTAPPVPFPPASLVGGELKANANTKPDGTVWLLAYKACNYSSGMGSSVVLAETRSGIAPTANAADRGLDDDTNGNPWYWNFENDHAGDGSPIPEVQLSAIVTATGVVLDHFGLPETAVVSHAEWTERKGDPYWNGDRRCIEEIRSRLELGMTPEQLRDIIREELDRRVDGKAGPTNAFYGVGGGVVSTYIGKTGRTLGQMVQNTDNQLAAIADSLGVGRTVPDPIEEDFVPDPPES